MDKNRKNGYIAKIDLTPSGFVSWDYLLMDLKKQQVNYHVGMAYAQKKLIDRFRK